MDMVVEDLDADDDAPEVHGEHGDIEEGCRGEPEEERRHAVEQRETERIPREIAADGTVPGSRAERVTVEDTRLGTVNDHAEEGHLAEHFIYGPCADEVFLARVGEAVESGPDQGEHVPLDLVAGGGAP